MKRQIPMKTIRWLLAAAMVAISCASMMTQAAPARMAQAAQPAAAPAQDARPAATDASLMNLAIDSGTLSPSFVSTTTSYAASVPNAAASMLVTPTLSDANAAYTITGSPGACTPATSPANCALSVGVNTITVTVTAEEGAT